MTERKAWRPLLAHLALALLPLAALASYLGHAPEVWEMRVDEYGLVHMADAMSRVAIGAGIGPCDELGFVSDLEGVPYEAAFTVAKFALAPAVVRPGAARKGQRHELVLGYFAGGGIPTSLSGDEWLLVNETPGKRAPEDRAGLWRSRQ